MIGSGREKVGVGLAGSHDALVQVPVRVKAELPVRVKADKAMLIVSLDFGEVAFVVDAEAVVIGQ